MDRKMQPGCQGQKSLGAFSTANPELLQAEPSQSKASIQQCQSKPAMGTWTSCCDIKVSCT